MRISSPVPDTSASGRLRSVLFVFLGFGFFAHAGAASEASGEAVLNNDITDVRSAQPAPTLSPDAVVRIQMQALGANASLGDDAGIEVAFRFASPANQRMTGPLERFVSLLKNPLYAPMLDHDQIEYAPSRDSPDNDGRAWVPVRLTAADGAQTGYLFILGRQTGDPCDCWMTESVQHIPMSEDGSAPRGPAI